MFESFSRYEELDWAAVFFHVYVFVIYELTYICLLVRVIELVSPIHFLFPGSNSSLQYLDALPSSDWSGCFLLSPRDWISLRWLIWSPLWPPLDWISMGSVISLPWTCGSTGFCFGMLVFLPKYKKTFMGIIQSVFALHVRLQWERFIVTLKYFTEVYFCTE